MREKITLEKFLDLKSKIMAEINYAEEHGEEIENVAGFVDELINKILSLQEELFSYDLSEVPFESWENLTLITDEDHKLDFTGTNANIDFSIFENPGNTDYHSCKIRHLEAVPSIARPDSFDEEVVKQYPNIFLSDSFSADFKEKYYNKELTLEDLTGLTDEQYDELKEKRIKWHMSDRNSLNASLSLKKIVEIYNYSKELYDMVLYIDDRRYYTSPDFSSTKYPSLMEKVEKAELSDIKDLYYNFLAEHLLQPQEDLSSPIYPVIFKRENANLFINDVDLPMDVRRRYATKKLTIMDLVNYPDVFKTLPIDTFVDRMNPLLSHFNQSYSVRDYINLIFKYPDVFKWISENRSEFDSIGSSYIPRVLEKLMVSGADAETTFLDGIKDFLAERIIVKEETRMGEDGTPEYVTVFDFPSWADSLHLKGIERIKTREELLSLDEHTLIYDKAQREVIKELGLENVKRIEQEFEIFSRLKSDMYRELPLLDILDRMMVNNNYSGIGHGRYTIVDFHKGSLNYPEFLRTFLQLMSNLQISNEIWNEYIKFKDELKQKYPGLVLAEDAPQALKEDFYSTNLTPKAFYNRPEYIPYLVDKDLLGVLDFAIPLITREGVDLKNNKFEPDRSDFIEEYQKRYGNEKTLQLLCRYGELLDEITIKALNNEIENEQQIEKCIIDAIYNYILKNKRDAKYEYLKSCPEFVSAHP